MKRKYGEFDIEHLRRLNKNRQKIKTALIMYKCNINNKKNNIDIMAILDEIIINLNQRRELINKEEDYFDEEHKIERIDEIKNAVEIIKDIKSKYFGVYISILKHNQN